MKASAETGFPCGPCTYSGCVEFLEGKDGCSEGTAAKGSEDAEALGEFRGEKILLRVIHAVETSGLYQVPVDMCGH